MSDGLPLWLKGIGTPGSNVGNSEVDPAELRLREMRLPPEFRMKGKARDLRDAYLGKMLLSEAMRPYNMPAAMGMQFELNLLERENSRAKLTLIIRELEQMVPDEQREKANEVAKQLFHWTFHDMRVEAVRKMR